MQKTPSIASCITSYALPTRTLTTKTLNQSLELFTNSTTPITLSGNRPLQLNINEERPLTVILAWLMSQKKHIHKYAKFYLDNGFDVLTVRTTPWQLLWPATGSQVCYLHLYYFNLQQCWTYFVIFRYLLMIFWLSYTKTQITRQLFMGSQSALTCGEKWWWKWVKISQNILLLWIEFVDKYGTLLSIMLKYQSGFQSLFSQPIHSSGKI